MDAVFIISPLVGSLIGYFTNWIAIKMLFRPLTKKKIFGFKIPFTPGVIPRRRQELAESIGNTVGKRLLTPDAFEKILQGPAMKSKVKEFIRSKIKNLETEDRGLEEILNQVFSDSQQTKKMKKLSKEIINRNIEESLKSDELAELIKSKLNSEKIANELDKYLLSKEYDDFKQKIIEFIQGESTKEYLTQELIIYIKQELENIDDDKRIKDIIPEQFIHSIKSWIKSQKKEIIKQLVDFIDSEELRFQIESKVDNFFDNNPMLSMLSGFKDKIVEKFLGYLIAFVEEEKNQEKIMNQIEKLIDSILESKISKISTQLNEEELEKISNKVVNELIKEENMQKLIAVGEKSLIKKLKSEQGDSNLRAVISKVIKNKLVVDLFNDIVDFKVEQLFSRSLSTYFKELSSDIVNQLESGIVNIIEYLMEHHLGTVFASLDFKNLVKKKIDSFNVLEVERLLLDVIETELKAITWFGAVLGFLLGLITPIISLL